MKTDYSKVTFPHETTSDGTPVRLFGVIGRHVIGATYYSYGDKETVSQVLKWAFDGKWEGGSYPHMNLAPHPDDVHDRIQDQLTIINEAKGNLALLDEQHPDAPQTWRQTDEDRIKNAERSIKSIATDCGLDVADFIAGAA